VKQAILFLGLTLGLSYFVFWGPLAVFQIPTISFTSKSFGPVWAIVLFILGGFVPSLVAIVLTWTGEGASGLRRLGRRVIQVNIGWRWHLAALGVVALATAGQLFIIRLLGQSFDMRLFLAQLGTILPLIILGPLSEELGWRGYALDRLQTKYSALISALIIGVAWALWHLPLFHMIGASQHELGMPFTGFAVGVTALSIIFTWLHNNTGGSIWSAVFLHWIYTYSGQVVASGVSRSPLYNWLECLPYVVIAAVIVTVWGRRSSSTAQSVE
jgi:membrane protease YdiL (CAAX protease family)